MSLSHRPGKVLETYVRVIDGESDRRRRDALAVEEPLEIRIRGGESLAVTMRTPGNDFELAAGFLLTEGLLRSLNQLEALKYCTDPSVDGEQQYNIVQVVLRDGVEIDADRLRRNFYTTSSCGVCGKASLDAIAANCAPVADGPIVDPDVVRSLPETLRRAQSLFEKTGGIHAAGLFDTSGRLITLREDVGRHNAVDKVIGEAFFNGRLPLTDHILMVSGRASFEIMQKAATAGVPIVVAVSAPSSLAVSAALRFNMTLIGFLRGERFNVYAGSERVAPPKAGATPDDGRVRTDAAPAPILCFVGPSGSGKTTLLTRLIRELRNRGVRVAAVKHSHHPLAAEPDGKDSARLLSAGAALGVAVGVDAAFVTLPGAGRAEEGVRSIIESAPATIDLVVVEGMKSSAFPKVLLVSSSGDPIDPAGISHLAAIVTDAATDTEIVHLGLPVFHRDNVPALADWVMNTYCRSDENGGS